MRVLQVEGEHGRMRPVRDADMAPGVAEEVLARASAGSIAVLPDGSYAEPVEEFPTESLAHARREALASTFPGEDFRTIVNTNLDLASMTGRGFS